MLEITKLAVRLAIVTQGRPARLDRLCEHGANRRHQRGHPPRRDAAGLAHRAYPRAVEHFADIDVAQTCDDSLIEKRRLDGRVPPREPPGQVGFVKTIAEWFRADSGQKPVSVEIGRRPKVHRAKAAGIVEGHADATFHVDDNVIVFRGRGMGVVELAKLVAGDQHPPRHAEVDDQRLVTLQIGKDVLRPSPQGRDALTGQPFAILSGSGQRKSGRFVSAVTIR